jgi:hypothetical protein
MTVTFELLAIGSSVVSIKIANCSTADVDSYGLLVVRIAILKNKRCLSLDCTPFGGTPPNLFNRSLVFRFANDLHVEEAGAVDVADCGN